MMMEKVLETQLDSIHETVTSKQILGRQERVHSSDDDVFLTGTPSLTRQSTLVAPFGNSSQLMSSTTSPRLGKSASLYSDSNGKVRPHRGKTSSGDDRLQGTSTYPAVSASALTSGTNTTSTSTTVPVSQAEPVRCSGTNSNEKHDKTDESSPTSSGYLPDHSYGGATYCRQSRPRGSIFDDLLFEIYDQWYDSYRDSFDSDTFTEYSSAAEIPHYYTTIRSEYNLESEDRRIKKYSRAYLENQGKGFVARISKVLYFVRLSLSHIIKKTF